MDKVHEVILYCLVCQLLLNLTTGAIRAQTKLHVLSQSSLITDLKIQLPHFQGKT